MEHGCRTVRDDYEEASISGHGKLINYKMRTRQNNFVHEELLKNYIFCEDRKHPGKK